MTDKGTERKLNITFAQLAPLPGFNLVKYLLVPQSLCVGGVVAGGWGGWVCCVYGVVKEGKISRFPLEIQNAKHSSHYRRATIRGETKTGAWPECMHAYIHTHAHTYTHRARYVATRKREVTQFSFSFSTSPNPMSTPLFPLHPFSLTMTSCSSYM